MRATSREWRPIANVRGSSKVPFRERWKENGRHCQYYTGFYMRVKVQL